MPGVEVKSLLQSVLDRDPSPACVARFFDLCRRMAAVYLRRKVLAGKLYPDLCSISVDDLAADCVADLFAVDESGRFYELCTYFETVSIQESCEEELLIRLRRLIVAKANRGIFRSLNEADPSLGKILRNIKLALQALGSFTLMERFGEPCLVPAMSDTLEHLPAIDRPELECAFLQSSGANNDIPSLLARLARLLTEQSERSRIVPLMSVALIFRSYYFSGRGAEAQEELPREFTVSDSMAIMREACSVVKEKAGRSYVAKGKVEVDLLDKYFMVIEESLKRTILENDGQDYSYYDRLRTLIPGLTKEEYFSRHRSKLEYLGNLAHKRAIKELRKNL